jgi:flagellar capping protein FliD
MNSRGDLDGAERAVSGFVEKWNVFFEQHLKADTSERCPASDPD